MGAEHLKLLEQAVTVPSAATLTIGEACKQAGMVMSIGVNKRDGGMLYDTQLLFDAASAARARSLRRVSVLLPLGEQRELVRCPIWPAGWHGRRVGIVRRECRE